MNRSKNTGLVLCGLVLGLSLSAPAAQAVESLKATLSTNRILVDGEEVRLTAYNINGNNYVMLRDVGKAVGFEVYWDGDAKCVQVESKKPYTGEAPVTSAEAKPVEQPAQTDVAAAKQDIIDRTNALRKKTALLCYVSTTGSCRRRRYEPTRWQRAASTLTHVRMGARAIPSPTANTLEKIFTVYRSCTSSNSTKRSPRRWSSCGPIPRLTRTT